MAVSIVDSGAGDNYSFSGTALISSLTLALNSAIVGGGSVNNGSTGFYLNWNSVTRTQVGSWNVVNTKSWRGGFSRILVDDALDEGTSDCTITFSYQGTGNGIAVAIAGVKTDTFHETQTDNAFPTGLDDFMSGINVGCILSSTAIGTVVSGTTVVSSTWSLAECGCRAVYEIGHGTGCLLEVTNLSSFADSYITRWEALPGFSKFIPMLGSNFAFLLAFAQVFPHLSRITIPAMNAMMKLGGRAVAPSLVTGDRVIVPYLDDLTITYDEILDRMRKPNLYLPKFMHQILTPDMLAMAA